MLHALFVWSSLEPFQRVKAVVVTLCMQNVSSSGSLEIRTSHARSAEPPMRRFPTSRHAEQRRRIPITGAAPKMEEVRWMTTMALLLRAQVMTTRLCLIMTLRQHYRQQALTMLFCPWRKALNQTEFVVGVRLGCESCSGMLYRIVNDLYCSPSFSKSSSRSSAFNKAHGVRTQAARRPASR